MTPFALALALLAAPDLPRRLSLEEPARQEPDQDRPLPNTELRPGESFTDYVYRNSRLEAGVVVTSFDDALNVETAFAWYVRWGVGVAEDVEVNLSFRRYEFVNGGLPALGPENLHLWAILAGAAWRLPMTSDFEFTANASAGLMAWETYNVGLSGALGPLLSIEAAVVWRVTDAVRIRAGALLDVAWSDFHAASTEASVSYGGLVSLEIGVR
jgi:hypothetical protein